LRKTKYFLLIALLLSLVYARETYDSKARTLQARLANDVAGIDDSPKDSIKDMQSAFQELDDLNTVSPFVLESSPWAAYCGHRLMGLEKQRLQSFSQVAQISEDADVARNNNPNIDLSPFIASHRTKMHEYTDIVDQVNRAMNGHIPSALYDALFELDK
jgi:hypothetical protein